MEPIDSLAEECKPECSLNVADCEVVKSSPGVNMSASWASARWLRFVALYVFADFVRFRAVVELG